MVIVLVTGRNAAANLDRVEGRPHRILLDTDVDTDDFFALLYILKLNRSEFELEVRLFLFTVFIFFQVNYTLVFKL